MSSVSLVCPKCAKPHSLDERYCSNCGMPLVYAGKTGAEGPITEPQERARKIKAEYSRGELAKVGWSRNQSEAEMFQNMLLEEGIPAVLRHPTFDATVPFLLAGGPRDVMAPESGAERARELLLEAGTSETPETSDTRARTLNFGLGLLAAIAVVATIVWVLVKLVS